ncbi:MAG: MraY family glycosyltransferase, partial [Acidobacteriota bacterium]
MAHRIGLVDEPSADKIHSGRIALVGGIAIFCGFSIGTLTLNTSLYDYRAFWAASFLLVVIGILDDFRELTPRARLIAQIGAAMLMIAWGGVLVVTLGPILSPNNLTLGYLAIPFTVIGVVGAINAMNLIDGVDGLCGGLAIICLAPIAMLSWQGGVYREAALAMALISAIAVFLGFNVRDATSMKAFMGDAGSMFVGFAIAWLLVSASQGDRRVMTPVTPLWLFAIPLIDTLGVMVRRFLRRQSPFRGDHTHLHHMLLDAGFSPRQVMAILLASAGLLALVGVGAMRYGVDDRVMFAGFVVVFGTVLAATLLRSREAVIPG